MKSASGWTIIPAQFAVKRYARQQYVVTTASRVERVTSNRDSRAGADACHGRICGISDAEKQR